MGTAETKGRKEGIFGPKIDKEVMDFGPWLRKIGFVV